jgi:hypothetical protein
MEISFDFGPICMSDAAQALISISGKKRNWQRG